MSFADALSMTFTTRSTPGKLLGVGGFFGLGSSVDGTVANSKTAFTLSAFYNGVEQLSNDIAKLPKSVKRKNGKNREDYSDHPVNYIISNEPNAMMTAFDFWKLIVVCMIIKGNAYAEIIRNKVTGRIESFIHLDSDDVTVYENNNKLFYVYKGRIIVSEDILHYKAFSFNGKIGVSVIRFAAKQLGISIDAQNYQQDVYKDRGLGYGVIEAAGDVNAVNKKAIEDGFASKMASKNKFKVPMLDSGMTYKSISVSPAEAQFLESNKNGVLEVCRWLNIAPHKLKVLDQSNFSNMQQQGIEHVQDSIVPWTMRIEQETGRKVFDENDKKTAYIYFNVNALLRGDMDSRKNFLTALVYAGVITRNEARAWEDLNPIDGLDDVLQPVNMQALSMANELLQQQINDKGNGNSTK